MQSITSADFYKQLNRLGITGAVKASQALEAFKLFLQSELPDAVPDCEPLYLRHGVLVVRSSNSAVMNALRDKQSEVIDFIRSSAGVKIDRIQFRA